MIKKKLFTIKDSWPWALTLMLFVGGYSIALVSGNTIAGLAIVGGIVAVTVGIAVFRYMFRYYAISKWNNAYQTSTGIVVISNAGQVPYEKIDAACKETMLYWSDWHGGGEAPLNKIAEALAGCTIIVFPSLLERSTPWWHGKFVGLQEDKTISVVYDKKIVVDESALINLVKHEVSHRCLTAIGVDPGNWGDLHHIIFSATKYC